MGKTKNKKSKEKCVPTSKENLLTKDDWIEIHEEAYYRAMKRLEMEKVCENAKKRKKEKWYELFWFVEKSLKKKEIVIEYTHIQVVL